MCGALLEKAMLGGLLDTMAAGPGGALETISALALRGSKVPESTNTAGVAVAGQRPVTRVASDGAIAARLHGDSGLTVFKVVVAEHIAWIEPVLA